jgi:hypothetical protein
MEPAAAGRAPAGQATPLAAATTATAEAAVAEQPGQQASVINPFSFNPQLLLADLSNAVRFLSRRFCACVWLGVARAADADAADEAPPMLPRATLLSRSLTPHTTPPTPKPQPQALDACADGFDALERQLLQALPLERAEKRALRDGVGQLWAAVLASLNDAATNFERVAAATALHVPAELSAAAEGEEEEEEQEAAEAAAGPGGEGGTTKKKSAFPPATEEDEAALDAELAELRAALVEARAGAASLRRELSAAARDRAAAAEAAPALRPLGAALAAHRASALEDVAAVSGAAARLRPLMARCEQLRGAAAAAAQRRAAMLGGRGQEAWAGAGPAAAAAANLADDAPAAAKSVREMMVDTGAGADQLRELCEAVGGPVGVAVGADGEAAGGGDA